MKTSHLILKAILAACVMISSAQVFAKKNSSLQDEFNNREQEAKTDEYERSARQRDDEQRLEQAEILRELPSFVDETYAAIRKQNLTPIRYELEWTEWFPETGGAPEQKLDGIYVQTQEGKVCHRLSSFWGYDLNGRPQVSCY